MKIYTRGGDRGETGLIGGRRVPKDDPRIEAYGGVDELNALLGQARALKPPAEMDRLLEAVQRDLFVAGAMLADPEGRRKDPAALGSADIERIEKAIDGFEAGLEPLRAFILPGGAPLSAALHHARTVARRAERGLAALGRRDPLPANLLPYLNRVADLLFVLARAANRAAGIEDVPWKPGSVSS